MEEWKDVIGYEGLYQVSNEGRVKSLERYVDSKNGSKRFEKEKILKYCITKNGYPSVILAKFGTRKLKKIHRLVGETFIPNPDNLPQINHKNEDKTDNRVENLEWCNQYYNNHYGTKYQRQIKTQMNREDCSKIVYQYSLNGQLITIWPSINEIERKMKILRQGITAVCLGKRKTYKGYKWSFEPL